MTVSYTLMLSYQPAHPLDFIQAFKAFIYIAPLCIIFKAHIFELRSIVLLLKILIVLFLLKYGYSILWNFTPRMGLRPGIFVENNFELLFLIILMIIYYPALGRYRNLWFMLLFFVVLISGSRSALLATFTAFIGIFFDRFSARNLVFASLGALALVGIIGFVFESRMDGGGIESIDRYKFFLIFLDEISKWGPWQYLFGAPPLTPLSPSSCQALQFYKNLFSYDGSGACFSVILHSYFLRVIFDHGVFGLCLMFYFIYFILTKANISKRNAINILGVLTMSALAVSSINSIFPILAISIVISTFKSSKINYSRELS